MRANVLILLSDIFPILCSICYFYSSQTEVLRLIWNSNSFYHLLKGKYSYVFFQMLCKKNSLIVLTLEKNINLSLIITFLIKKSGYSFIHLIDGGVMCLSILWDIFVSLHPVLLHQNYDIDHIESYPLTFILYSSFLYYY